MVIYQNRERSCPRKESC